MTNNENWRGGAKRVSNPNASRDGNKPFERKDVKKILKGSRGAAKFNSDNRRHENESDGSKLEFRKKDENRSYNSNERKPYENRPKTSYGERKPYESRPNTSYGERKPYQSRFNAESTGENTNPKRQFRSAGYDRDANAGRFNSQEKSFNNRNRFNSNNDGESVRPKRFNTDRSEKLTLRKPGEAPKGDYTETRFDNRRDGVVMRKPIRKRNDEDYDPNAKYSSKKQLEFRKSNVDPNKPMRLNKFLANAGICSRREADEYIQAGVITVNGEIVSELGVKVLPTDKVMFHNQQVRSERKVYLLLNKPKDCVTTVEDTHERTTVLDLVKNACSERIYPVGRLDRNTTGVLLLTNDGDLASKLTHPKYDKKKIYHIALDRVLETVDFEKILSGVTLEDGEIAADALEYVKEGDLKQVGIEIHSGQNRIVRRIFEKLGYKVIRLDRVYFAGLTKKNIPRGKYRFLNEREINMLKMGAYE